MVLRRQDRIPHAGGLRAPRPFAGVEEIGIEELEIPPVLLVRLLLAKQHLLVPGGLGVEPEMDEQAEPVVRPPLRPLVAIPRRGTGRNQRQHNTHHQLPHSSNSLRSSILFSSRGPSVSSIRLSPILNPILRVAFARFPIRTHSRPVTPLFHLYPRTPGISP